MTVSAAQIWRWRQVARARLLRTRFRLGCAILRYWLLWLKHYGWIWIAMRILKIPDYLKAMKR